MIKFSHCISHERYNSKLVEEYILLRAKIGQRPRINLVFLVPHELHDWTRVDTREAREYLTIPRDRLTDLVGVGGRPWKIQRAREQQGRVPSSPEVEELSSGSGDDPGDRRPSLESDLPYSLPPPLPLPPRWSSRWRVVPFSGETDRDSLDSATPYVPPRRPSLASSPGNRLLKSVGIAGRFLGVRLRSRHGLRTKEEVFLNFFSGIRLSIARTEWVWAEKRIEMILGTKANVAISH